MSAELKYAAFISYRHDPLSRGWAIWLHRQIERYRVPKPLQSRNGCPARLGKVFRDEDELAASSDLSAAIDEALRSSRFLIVICSPSTPQSRWVNEEVRRFRALGRGGQILSLLVKGTPDETFPPALLEARRAGANDPSGTLEPCAADVRDVHQEGARHTREVAKLRLIAAMLGVDFDDLYRREARAQRARWTKYAIAASVLLVLLAMLTAFAFAQRQLATESRDDAIRALQESERQLRDARLQRAAALASVNALIFQVQREMESRPSLAQSRINLMNLALSKLDAIEEISAVWDVELRRAEAVATMQIADARAQMRQHKPASDDSGRAVTLFQAILAKSPQDAQARRDLVLCLVRHARISARSSSPDIAATALRDAEALLTDADPAGTLAERFSVAIAKGDIATMQGDLPLAARSFQEAATTAPNASQQQLLAGSRVATVLLMQPAPEAKALQETTALLDECAKSLQSQPGASTSLDYSIATARLRSGEIRLRMSDWPAAIERTRDAVEQLTRVHAAMPDRDDVSFTLGAAYVSLAAATTGGQTVDREAIRSRAMGFFESMQNRARAAVLTEELSTRCANPSSQRTRAPADSEIE